MERGVLGVAIVPVWSVMGCMVVLGLLRRRGMIGGRGPSLLL